ncbi:MAG: M13 family metallopeptidase [Muribaculaceae bacterium]|jgi:putative endopeptidase|nr:M13 family metallopeptidase [Muribaculaceae bacterium]
MKKNNILFLMAAVVASGAYTACTKSAASPKGIEAANLDTTVSPKVDFYEYACGGWMKANPLKPEYSRYGTFDELGENNREQLKELVLGLDPNAADGTNAQKVRDLYAMGMDSLRLNEEGAAPLAKDLATIAAANRDSLVELMATMPGLGIFFGTGVSSDLADSNVNTMYWGQGGLGLGDRDYYTEKSERNDKILAAYRTYLETVASLAGYDKAAASRLASNVIKLETTLAADQMTRTQQRDIAAQYNVRAVADLDKEYPSVNLKRYFELQNLNVDTIIVDSPKYYATVAKALAEQPEEVLRDYAAASYISSAAPYLSDDFINADFKLSQVLSGVEEQRPRWKRALSVPNSVLGEVVGQLYVEKYFPESSKERMLTLVGNLQESLGEHIDSLTWMSDTTKMRAKEKLASFRVKIGYPDNWRDYSALEINPGKSYWENIQSAILFNQDYNNSDYGKPVDRERWLMSPQTVNAYYNPSTNEICFPAGILQPPFFDPEADDAVNYGAIGVVIGHEMTHGFDDQGRQFDKDGNFADWWTPADAEAFNALADKLVAQFDSIEVAPGLRANGRLTLGENIADQGGLRVAYTAYKNSLNGIEGPVIDGFTPDQRFYLAYSNVWAGNIREDEIRQRTMSDPHSLGKWRVNASLRNIEPFFTAFGITESDPMFRPASERVIIW